MSVEPGDNLDDAVLVSTANREFLKLALSNCQPRWATALLQNVSPVLIQSPKHPGRLAFVFICSSDACANSLSLNLEIFKGAIKSIAPFVAEVRVELVEETKTT